MSAKVAITNRSNEQALREAALAFETTGYTVSTQRVDVSSCESVRALANAAAELAPVMQLVHTGGLSPNMASPKKYGRSICSARPWCLRNLVGWWLLADQALLFPAWQVICLPQQVRSE